MDHRTLDDLAAVPRPVVGTGGATFVHLALWPEIGFHGEPSLDLPDGPLTLLGNGFRPGRAEGLLIGGSLGPIRAMIGNGLPDLTGTILLLTGERTQGLGQVDRQLTHLRRAGVFRQVGGVAVGRFADFEGHIDRGWTLEDVLDDQLGGLGLPVVRDLPIGPGEAPVPLGVPAVLDAETGTLAISALPG